MALIAVGLVLIFGVMGVINFAHGELYMAGAYCGRVTSTLRRSFPFLVAVAAGLIFVGAVLGLLMERGLFRPMRGKSAGRPDRRRSAFFSSCKRLVVFGFGRRMGTCPAADPGQDRDIRRGRRR